MVNLAQCCSSLWDPANIAAFSAHGNELGLLCLTHCKDLVPSDGRRVWPITDLRQAISEIIPVDHRYEDIAGNVSTEDYDNAPRLLYSIMLNKDESSSLAKALVTCSRYLQHTYSATTGDFLSESSIDIAVDELNDWSFGAQFTDMSEEMDTGEAWILYEEQVPPFMSVGALMRQIQGEMDDRVRNIMIVANGMCIVHTEDARTNDYHIPPGVAVQVYYRR
jgi:hypothetical protein